MMKILLIFTLWLTSGPLGCADVTGYLGGSIIIISDVQLGTSNSKYICKMENRQCTDIIRANTKEKIVQVERFTLYTNTYGHLTVLIRNLKPHDSGTYKMGKTSTSTDVNLIVVNDSCCAGPKIMNAEQGQNTSITFNYPAKYEEIQKYLIKLDNVSVTKTILDTERKSQDSRFSISDNRGSQVFSVNISDVREEDDGVYLFGVKKTEKIRYYSYIIEIQLHVRVNITMMTPTVISSEGLDFSSSVIIIGCVCCALLLIGGSALMIYKLGQKRTQGSKASSKDNEQAPLDGSVYEEVNHAKHDSVSDTELDTNASSPSNPKTEISTVQPPQDHNLTYITVSFHKNPDDAAVSFSKEESASEYATVRTLQDWNN